MDGAFPSDTSNTGGGWEQQGQEWTLEEDLEVMQELKNIREAEIRREIIFFWLPAALHLSSFVFYNEAMAPLTALNALLFGWTRAL